MMQVQGRPSLRPLSSREHGSMGAWISPSQLSSFGEGGRKGCWRGERTAFSQAAAHGLGLLVETASSVYYQPVTLPASGE